jgi:hypothetical protein
MTGEGETDDSGNDDDDGDEGDDDLWTCLGTGQGY